MTVAILGSVNGTVAMKLTGTVTKGGLVESVDAGLVQAAGTSSAYIVGVALESGISGDLVEVTDGRLARP
jgi:hypothetical protein